MRKGSDAYPLAKRVWLAAATPSDDAGDEQVLAWEYDVDGGWQRGDQRRVLAAFVKLANASPEEVRTFAERYGVLGTCPHRFPSGAYGHDPGRDGQQGCRPTRREPLWLWRAFAREARALVALIAAVKADDRFGTAEHWADLHRSRHERQGYNIAAVGDPSGRALSPAEVRELVRAGMQSDPQTTGALRGYLAVQVRKWLAMGALELEFSWPEVGGPTLLWRGSGVIGVVARQLAAQSAAVSGLAPCANCGEFFALPVLPGPQGDPICPVCRKDPSIAERLRKRRQRAALKAEGVPVRKRRRSR